MFLDYSRDELLLCVLSHEDVAVVVLYHRERLRRKDRRWELVLLRVVHRGIDVGYRDKWLVRHPPGGLNGNVLPADLV